MENIIKVLNEWYNDGFATWDHKGAPGKSGIFGGSFKSMSELVEVENNEYEVYVEFGSADPEDAVENLNSRLNAIGYECDCDCITSDTICISPLRN